MKRPVYVVGVGMTKFEKPGARQWDYYEMGKEAASLALKDAGIEYSKVQAVFAGYCYGETTCGQRAVYELGLTGVPVFNVNNACSTGSSALYLAANLVEGGLVDCALAVGFEKMEKGSLGIKYTDREPPMRRHLLDMKSRRGLVKAPTAPQIFGNAGREYMEKYGIDATVFAKVAEKNHRHSAKNPYAQFQQVYSLEEILDSQMIYEPLTKLQCCPTSDGGAAAVLASEEFVEKHGLEEKAVRMLAKQIVTDLESTFSGSDMAIAGYFMSKEAATRAYQEAGLGPEDVQVIELHDCFSTNELITYEALGLAKEGEGWELVEKGEVDYGGKWVVNPSGGLISKGHPLGATGLAQATELTWQLRGEAGDRQVKDARVALQHNIGLGGAAAVFIYTRQ